MGLNGSSTKANRRQNADEFRSFLSIKIPNKFLYPEFNQLISFSPRNIVMKERSVTRLDSKLRRHSIPLADRNVCENLCP